MLPHALVLQIQQFSKLSTLKYELMLSVLHCIADDEDMSVKAVIVAHTLRPT